MSKGFITGTNEELIKAYKESRDESSLTFICFAIITSS